MQAKKTNIESSHFGEGSTFFDNKIYMMTWKNGIVYIFDKNLELLDTISMPKEMKEGWGLTHDGTYLYATDGTANIYVITPGNFKVINHVTVKDS